MQKKQPSSAFFVFDDEMEKLEKNEINALKNVNIRLWFVKVGGGIKGSVHIQTVTAVKDYNEKEK